MRARSSSFSLIRSPLTTAAAPGCAEQPPSTSPASSAAAAMLRLVDVTVYLPRHAGGAPAPPIVREVAGGLGLPRPSRTRPRALACVAPGQSTGSGTTGAERGRSEEHTSELQSRGHLVC